MRLKLRKAESQNSNFGDFLLRSFCGLGAVILLLSLTGCPPPPPPPPPLPPPAEGPKHIITGDAAPAPDTSAIRMTMYRLEMPFGANSRDDAFWKLVDEDVIDVPIAQSLNRNGFRIGRARISDWPEFLKILTNESAIKASQAMIIAPPSFESGELPLSDVIPSELLFIFDDHGLTMRSYNNCRNMFATTLEWVPRRPGAIRLTLCPMIQVPQMRMDYSLSDDPAPVKYLKRENFYDLHLTADIAPGEFLVVGTSTATEDRNRVASRFLTLDGPNRRYEDVLIFVGEPGPMDKMQFRRPKTTTANQPK
jgi:hypothetical protein